MPRDLFGDVTRPSVSIGNRKWYTLPLSLVSHSAIVLTLIALPILAPALMPTPWEQIDAAYITELVPPSPPPRPRPIDAQPAANPEAAPYEAPETIAPEKDLDVSWQDTASPGVVGGIEDAETALVPPPPVAPPAPTRPVPVGGAIRAPLKVKHVMPAYPQLALLSRVQGIVIIEATIGADGRVVDARILRSVPLLDQAALDAVRQWEFTPTLLNGVPVPVVMSVTVTFTLK